MGAGAAGAAEQEGAVMDGPDPHPVAARLGIGLDQDRPVGEDAGVVAGLDRADLGGEPIGRVAVVDLPDRDGSDWRNSFFSHVLIVPKMPVFWLTKLQVNAGLTTRHLASLRPKVVHRPDGRPPNRWRRATRLPARIERRRT
jgi:hypothetical protein